MVRILSNSKKPGGVLIGAGTAYRKADACEDERYGISRPEDRSSVEEGRPTWRDSLTACHAMKADIRPPTTADVQGRRRPYPGHFRDTRCRRRV
jgi:hypothetical protein